MEFAFDFLIMEMNINCNSFDSFHNNLASFFKSGIALAIILSQCFDSLASFLLILNLCSKSFLDSAQSASQ